MPATTSGFGRKGASAGRKYPVDHDHGLAVRRGAAGPKQLRQREPADSQSANVHYETIMGSVAYGVSSDTSDMDVYGFAIPPKDDVFPHLRGEILCFGKQHKRFEHSRSTTLAMPMPWPAAAARMTSRSLAS